MVVYPINGLALCAGIGGIELGLHQLIANYRTACFVEKEAYQASCLVSRMEEGFIPPAPVYSDITTFDGSEWYQKIHLVTAGYPCQPFSVAGKRKGKQDARHLWPHVLRIVQETQAPAVFLENVRGHVKLGLQEVLTQLSKCGFNAEWGIFNASNQGAPHRRERLFILAYSRKYLVKFKDQWREDQSYTTWDGEERRLARQQRTSWPSEPELDRVVSDGSSYWMDRHHAIGNAVIPRVAATAFYELAHRLEAKYE